MAEKPEPLSVTAEACANIAFIKYWGNRGAGLNLPLNVSISMNLESCVSRTTAALLQDAGADADEFVLNGRPAETDAASRVSGFLERIRDMAAESHLRLRASRPRRAPRRRCSGLTPARPSFPALRVLVPGPRRVR